MPAKGSHGDNVGFSNIGLRKRVSAGSRKRAPSPSLITHTPRLLLGRVITKAVLTSDRSKLTLQEGITLKSTYLRVGR